ncbi:hypothetical protein PoB_004071200 [Plakobranchus ocellatus]|uniref:Uncharacterized protein n=1 Tax=Plakobranchus ocellatus TaxID=259542 RepID=A0AAV4B525_9GAST|nr:hypothetical protein PoB_004071200 [Plakobranchus ocellatus]
MTNSQIKTDLSEEVPSLVRTRWTVVLKRFQEHFSDINHRDVQHIEEIDQWLSPGLLLTSVATCIWSIESILSAEKASNTHADCPASSEADEANPVADSYNVGPGKNAVAVDTLDGSKGSLVLVTSKAKQSAPQKRMTLAIRSEIPKAK